MDIGKNGRAFFKMGLQFRVCHMIRVEWEIVDRDGGWVIWVE